ncbi:CPBP family intramembrane glutamic endopeptidase [Halocola ammonii]
MANSFLRSLSPAAKVIIFLPLTYVFGLIFSGLAILILSANLGLSYEEVFSIVTGQKEDPNDIQILRWTNAANQLGSFIVASILFVVMFSREAVDDFWSKRGSWMLLFVPIFMIFTLSQIEWTIRLNEWLIPEGSTLEGIFKPFEDRAADMTERMMNMPNVSDLLLNLLLFAALPAVGEELAFRGIVQSQMAKATKRIHLSIWITAFVFSAIHMQFYGFLPRMMLGAIFGYLLIWSGTIWAPILAHFTNNALAVITYYYIQHDPSFTDGQLESQAASPLITVISIVIFVGFLMLFTRYSKWSEISGKYLFFDNQSVR